MTFELTYFWFNLLEGIFWIFLSGACLYVVRTYKVPQFNNLARFTSVTLFVFGISDFVEIYTNGFIGHDTWLLVWKALCVFGLIVSLIWHARIRIKE